MRVDKIRGKKYCMLCGKEFGYVNIRKVFCSNICCSRYYKLTKDIKKDRPITLAYIPEHLIEKEQ